MHRYVILSDAQHSRDALSGTDRDSAAPDTLRVVPPYHFTFGTSIKARWIGRPVLEIFSQEFPCALFLLLSSFFLALYPFLFCSFLALLSLRSRSPSCALLCHSFLVSSFPSSLLPCPTPFHLRPHRAVSRQRVRAQVL